MILVEPAPYLPFMDPRRARLPGLVPLGRAEWIEVAPDYAAQMRRREELVAARRDAVLGALPEGAAPLRELLDTLLDLLAADGRWTVEGKGVTRPDGVRIALDRADPLATLARLVQEDLCLLVPDPASGEYKLVAGTLCFPSRWLLADKLGQPMTEIHVPVPHYDTTLARRVNRLFEAIQPGREVYRVNWMFHPTAELHLIPRLTDGLMRVPGPDGEMYLRTERQGLVRLPRTGAVVFSIKTSVSRFSSLAPEEARALSGAIRALAPEVVAYKGSEALREHAVRRLAEIAGRDAGGAAS